MNSELYIWSVIKKHAVNNLITHRVLSTASELYPLIRIWGQILASKDRSGILLPPNYILKILPTGSFAKGTSIVGETDLDIFISLSHKTPDNLATIYHSLAGYLKLLNFTIRQQNVSIGISYKDLAIDLVPGKKQPGVTYDHSIYKRKAGTWTKTNIYKHISHIKGCGRRNEIRAVKIWRKLHKLEFPSFYLELSVIEALKRRSLAKLFVNFARVLEYFSCKFENVSIVDPANSNNIISEDLSVAEKKHIAETAYTSLNQSLDSVIW